MFSVRFRSPLTTPPPHPQVAIQQESLAAALPRLKRKVAEQKLKAERDLAGAPSAAGSESEAVLLFSEKVNAVQRAFSAAAEVRAPEGGLEWSFQGHSQGRLQGETQPWGSSSAPAL